MTPPTICVPYSMACWQWKVPVLPVKPWQMTLVSAKTAGGGGFAAEEKARALMRSAVRERVAMSKLATCAKVNNLITASGRLARTNETYRK